jgi:hypothetical protein
VAADSFIHELSFGAIKLTPSLKHDFTVYSSFLYNLKYIRIPFKLEEGSEYFIL